MLGRTTSGPTCASCSHAEEHSISASVLVHQWSGVIELTCLCLGDALPLIFWLPEATRAKLAWSAGFHVTDATVGLTVGTQVVVAVSRPPPEKRPFYSEPV